MQINNKFAFFKLYSLSIVKCFFDFFVRFFLKLIKKAANIQIGRLKKLIISLFIFWNYFMFSFVHAPSFCEDSTVASMKLIPILPS